jgi:hypothetical protein
VGAASVWTDSLVSRYKNVMTTVDLIWNRACKGEGRNLCNGDRALAALLKAHGLTMNGGLLHAVECLSASELAEAQSGYRFFNFDSVAKLLAVARRFWEAGDDLEYYESQLNHDYTARIPDDSSLFERFKSVYKIRVSEFSPFDSLSS